MSSPERFRQRAGSADDRRSNSVTGLTLLLLLTAGGIALLGASSLIPGVTKAASNRRKEKS